MGDVFIIYHHLIPYAKENTCGIARKDEWTFHWFQWR
jgi:hypothetical protein